MFRILKALLFLGFVSVMTVLFVVCNLTMSDLLACILAFLPSGWAILLVSIKCLRLLIDQLLLRGEKGRSYDFEMALFITYCLPGPKETVGLKGYIFCFLRSLKRAGRW